MNRRIVCDVTITKFGFDAHGQSVPLRACLQGRDIALPPPEHDGLIAIAIGQVYYWLCRGQQGWQILADT